MAYTAKGKGFHPGAHNCTQSMTQPHERGKPIKQSPSQPGGRGKPYPRISPSQRERPRGFSK